MGATSLPRSPREGRRARHQRRLRDEIDLPRSLCLEQLRLAHDLVEAERPVAAAHERNRAEGAAVVAALADLEIPHVRQLTRKKANPGVHDGSVVNQSHRCELGDQTIDVRSAEEEIDLR
jgi:hypothetical protein